MTKAILLAVLSSTLAVLITDLDAFSKARQADPNARFDWALFAVRLVKGACIGLVAGLGGTGVNYATS